MIMLKMIPPTRNSPFLESPPANSSFQKIINFASSSPDEERWSTGIIIITLAYVSLQLYKYWLMHVNVSLWCG
jgi:hypothetical protein